MKSSATRRGGAPAGVYRRGSSRPPGPGTVWRNWAGTATATPARWYRPRTEAEICAAVKDAAAAGLPLRALGSGHSFTAAAATTGVALDLSQWTGITAADTRTGLVTARSGTTLRALNAELAGEQPPGHPPAHDAGRYPEGERDPGERAGLPADRASDLAPGKADRAQYREVPPAPARPRGRGLDDTGESPHDQGQRQPRPPSAAQLGTEEHPSSGQGPNPHMPVTA